MTVPENRAPDAGLEIDVAPAARVPQRSTFGANDVPKNDLVTRIPEKPTHRHLPMAEPSGY